MIIIDEGAESVLAETLRQFTAFDGKYCLRIHPVDGDREETLETIVAQVQGYLPEAHLYLCDDDEIFLLSTGYSAKEVRKALFAIATMLKVQPVEHLGELYDLSVKSGPLILLLEKKLERQRLQSDEDIQQQRQAQAAQQLSRKRQEILDQGVQKTAQQIAQQRDTRDEPQFMIIEDDPFSRRLVDNILQKKYRMAALASADGALSTYANLAPDLLFLDINLPDVSGHELLEKIITLDPKAYVIMLSGNADRSNIVNAIEHGAAGFVAKPFSHERLVQYIERCPTIKKESA